MEELLGAGAHGDGALEVLDREIEVSHGQVDDRAGVEQVGRLAAELDGLIDDRDRLVFLFSLECEQPGEIIQWGPVALVPLVDGSIDCFGVSKSALERPEVGHVELDRVFRRLFRDCLGEPVLDAVVVVGVGLGAVEDDDARVADQLGGAGRPGAVAERECLLRLSVSAEEPCEHQHALGLLGLGDEPAVQLLGRRALAELIEQRRNRREPARVALGRRGNRRGFRCPKSRCRGLARSASRRA